jgi:carbamoyl-phosphate synthase large subunit
MMTTILITGAGGGVGQGVIKSLKMIKDMDITVVAADMSELATGLYAADVAYLVDRCDSDGYLESLSKIFKKESIDFYIPGTDVELEFCAKNKQLIIDEFNVHTIISSLEVIRISDDKYKTASFLRENKFNYPATSYLNDIDIKDVKYPVIVKPAIGCRSIGVYKVNSLDELVPHLKDSKDTIIQEYVGSEEKEYTCTVVKVGDELSQVLAMKRVLRSGDTYRAEPIKSEKIEKYVSDIATKLDIDGSCNFQLRLDMQGEPKIFEINSRFSGTTPFCAQIGFNPIEFYLKKTLGIECSVSVNYKVIILRHWSEIVIDKSELNQLSDEGTIKPCVEKQFKLFP